MYAIYETQPEVAAHGALTIQIGYMSKDSGFLFKCDFDGKEIDLKEIVNLTSLKSEKFTKVDDTTLESIEELARTFPLHVTTRKEATVKMTMKDGTVWSFEYVDPFGNKIGSVDFEEMMDKKDKELLASLKANIQKIIYNQRQKK